jgi:mono/diheme cytochrome c family protein
MKWVTREKAWVDGIACSWLITRFIDKEPTFLSQRGSSRGGQVRSRRSVALMLTASLLVGLLWAEGLVWAEGGGARTGNSAPPFDLGDPAKVEAGSRLFRANCTHYCHNPEGRAARAPALRGRDLSPEFIYQRIAKGVAPMPAYETVLSSEQIWTLVAYIESLAKAKD